MALGLALLLPMIACSGCTGMPIAAKAQEPLNYSISTPPSVTSSDTGSSNSLAELGALATSLWCRTQPLPANLETFNETSKLTIKGNGKSMFPTIPENSILTVIPYAYYEPKICDIGTYRDANGTIIIHRIVAISDCCYLFRGDNNAWTDGWIEKPETGVVIIEINIV